MNRHATAKANEITDRQVADSLRFKIAVRIAAGVAANQQAYVSGAPEERVNEAFAFADALIAEEKRRQQAENGETWVL